jgi:hypothetical protein
MDFMLDTSAINRMLDCQIDNEWSLRGRNFVTDIQLQEILNTSDPARRDYLFYGLMAMSLNVIRPTDMLQLFDCGMNFDTGERFMTGMGTVWHTGSMLLSFGNIVPIVAAELPRNRKRPENPLRDGFIAEAAFMYGMTLVTADGRLAGAAEALGVRVEHIT